jgi:hypothetical protein
MIAINIHSFLFEGVHIANNVGFIVIDLNKFVIFYLSKLEFRKILLWTDPSIIKFLSFFFLITLKKKIEKVKYDYV